MVHYIYHMQRFITSVLIVIFVGLAVFGLSFMAHQGNASHDGCLAGGASNGVCTQDIGAFSMINLHFSALTNFSSATFSGLPLTDALVLLGVFFAFLPILGINGLAHKYAVLMRQRRSFDLLHSIFHQQLIGWLALHNRRNPSLARVFSF